MSRVGVQCEDCNMIFESEDQLSRHKAKFCINSKYGNEEVLNSQFQKLAQGKNISLLGKNTNRSALDPAASSIRQPNVQSFINGPEGDIDREYRMLLKEIGQRQDLKNKLQRERRQAEEELANLEEREKEVVVEAKRNDLMEVIKRREELSKEQETLEKEIKSFEKERREEQRQKANQPNEDFVYREGREAGKLAMQRRMLEEKKRDLESNLKAKKREQEKIQKELGNLNEMPIFIPEFKLKETQPKPIVPSSPQRIEQLPQPIRETSQTLKATSKLRQTRNERLDILQPESIIKPKVIPENQLMKSSSKRSNVSQVSEDESYLRASRFAGNEKTLFQSLNPKGKSDEDIFIQSLVAQEYDALNLLARIPKESQLYQVKLKQFQEMSKVRQELKDKIQMVRLQKVKRQFQLQKQMTETEKANLQWLDNNRKQMLSKGVDIIQRKPIDHSRTNQIISNDPTQQNPSFKNVPNQFFNNDNNGIPSFSNVPPSIQRLPTQIGSAGLKGHRITVKTVKNYDNDGPLSVKLLLMEDGSNKPRFIFNTKYHDGFAPKDQRDPYNPMMRNRKDEHGNVNFNESFEVREDLQSLYNSNQNDIYLWITLMQKDGEKLTNEPSIYLWYCFKLTHFGQVRQGTFTLSLYHQNFPFPIPSDMNRIKGKAQEEIVIELSDIILTQERPPIERQPSTVPYQPSLHKTNLSKKSNSYQSNNNDIRGVTSNTRRSKQHAMKIKVDHLNQDGVKNFDQEYFHQNEGQVGFVPASSSTKISFNVVIAGLRTLPSSIGPLKLQINIIDSTGRTVLPKQQQLSELNGDMYNPIVNMVKTVDNQEMPSSSVLLIRITALNVLNYEPGLLGFAYFHLFYNEAGEVIQTDDFERYFLINGQFQLPIYFGSTKGYLTQPALQAFPKIPCVSLLLSIGTSPKVEAPPSYSSGRYNTTFFDLGEIETRLFAQQDRRQQQQIEDYVGAYMKFKGINNFSEDQCKKMLSQALAFNLENINHMHDLKNMAEYNPSFGIVVGVDMLTIPAIKRNYYYFCSLCLSPPANYYSKGENDLIFLYKIDLGTSLTQDLIFADDLLSFSPSFNINTAVIVELMRIEVSENGTPTSNIQSCASTILPLFDLSVDFVCVNVGNHDIRMENEQFDEKNIKRVQSNLRDFLDEAKGKQKSQFSIKIRVLNGFFPNQYSAPKSGAKGKPLRSIFQNSKGFKNTQDSVKKIIQTSFGVKLE